jgi:hypothetical protein
VSVAGRSIEVVADTIGHLAVNGGEQIILRPVEHTEMGTSGDVTQDSHADPSQRDIHRGRTLQ